MTDLDPTKNKGSCLCPDRQCGVRCDGLAGREESTGEPASWVRPGFETIEVVLWRRE